MWCRRLRKFVMLKMIRRREVKACVYQAFDSFSQGTAKEHATASVFTNSLRIYLSEVFSKIYPNDKHTDILKRLMLDRALQTPKDKIHRCKVDVRKRFEKDGKGEFLAEYHGHKLLWAWHEACLLIDRKKYEHAGELLFKVRNYSARNETCLVFVVDNIVQLAKPNLKLILDADYTPTGSLIKNITRETHAH